MCQVGEVGEKLDEVRFPERIAERTGVDSGGSVETSVGIPPSAT